MQLIDEEKVSTIRKKLREQVTVAELMKAAGVSARTVYRYIDLLVERGFNVVRANITRPTKYQIKKEGQ